jgi:galactokinase
MQQIEEKVKKAFTSHFDEDFIMVKSPGRVNLIGGHTDYNDGFVLPSAIDKHTVLAMAVNNSDRARFYAIDKKESFEASLTGTLQKSAKGWPDYLLGVVDQLQKRGYQPKGFDCAFGGNIPMGAGLSSSAALEGGVLFGLVQLFDWDIAPVEMASIARQAENEFVGVQCGIMDQFISLNGKKNRVMKLDCRSLDYEYYPFHNNGVRIILCDTQVRRELASSEYNVRRHQCEEGVKILREYDSAIRSLRDVSMDFLMQHREALDTTLFKRCKYIIEENERVLASCKDLQHNDMESFGQRLYASHAGLRDEYEVSCRELDVLVEASKHIEGVFGARMMGGGFGGCTINLVESSQEQAFHEKIQEAYSKETGREIEIYKTSVSGGTHLIEKEKENVN